jgi:hypothetical protein
LDTKEYQYKNIPLTPNICKELILELFNGKLEMRQTIIDGITTVHLGRGGHEGNAKDKARMVKKALEYLKKEGLAKNPSHGFWLINTSSKSEINDTNGLKVQRQNTEPNEKISECEDYATDLVLGEGDSAVYLYYLPTYQSNSKSQGRNTWACKIGKTNRDPLQRIISQASTALPEKPKIAVIIKTDNPHVLEQAVHSILTYRNKQIETALGKEWFDTSPDEFLQIVQFIEQSTLLFK